MMGRDWKLKKPFYCTQLSISPRFRNHLSGCITDIKLTTRHHVHCPMCGSIDWSTKTLEDDPEVITPNTVMNCRIQCTGTSNSTAGCAYGAPLHEFILSCEHKKLLQDVAAWMSKMGINNGTATQPQKGIGSLDEKMAAPFYDSMDKLRAAVRQEDEELAHAAASLYDVDVSEKNVEPKPTCETDKPEGTRDVDKFLKEQQDKLWRRD